VNGECWVEIESVLVSGKYIYVNNTPTACSQMTLLTATTTNMSFYRYYIMFYGIGDRETLKNCLPINNKKFTVGTGIQDSIHQLVALHVPHTLVWVTEDSKECIFLPDL